MTATETRPVASPSRLQNRLDAALGTETREIADRIGRQAYAALSRTGTPIAYRNARLIALLAAYALDGCRPEAARRMRWRRLIRAVCAFTRSAHSRALEQLLAENIDLL